MWLKVFLLTSRKPGGAPLSPGKHQGMWIWSPNWISHLHPLQQEPPARARASPHHCWSQHSPQPLVMASTPKKNCQGTTALRGVSDSSQHRGTDGGEEVPQQKNWVDTAGDTQREQLHWNLGISKIPRVHRKNKRDSEEEKANGQDPRDTEIRLSIFWVKSLCWHTQLLCQITFSPARHGNPLTWKSQHMQSKCCHRLHITNNVS